MHRGRGYDPSPHAARTRARPARETHTVDARPWRADRARRSTSPSASMRCTSRLKPGLAVARVHAVAGARPCGIRCGGRRARGTRAPRTCRSRCPLRARARARRRAARPGRRRRARSTPRAGRRRIGVTSRGSRRGSSSTSSNSPATRRCSDCCDRCRSSSSGGSTQSAHVTSSSTSARWMRAVFGFGLDAAARSAPSARRMRASSSTAAATASWSIVIDAGSRRCSASCSRRSSGARSRAGCRARRTRSARSGRAARRGARGPWSSTRPFAAQDLPRSARARGRSAATRCSRRYCCRSSTSGNAAPKRSAHIGLNATTTSPFSALPRNMFASGYAMLLAIR